MRKPNDHPVRPTDFIAFVDETGDDSLADPNHRVFGLGGCALPAALYDDMIVDPWLSLRDQFFPEHCGPLHAAELSHPTRAQLEAIAAFFATTPFVRVASLVSSESSVSARRRAYEKCSDTLLAFLHNVASAACDRIVIVFEASDKDDAKASQFLRQRVRFGGAARDFLPVEVFRAPKCDCHPGLEIADFVMHAAGTQVRKGVWTDQDHRKDFAAVFANVPDAWVRFGFLDVSDEDQ
jgi:hypothetical protein